MDDTEKRIVSGFEYATADDAEKAANELSGIEFVRSRTDMNNPKLVLSVYNKMVEKNLFRTLNGYAFLKELQDYLYSSSEIGDEEIKPIKAPYLDDSKKKLKDDSVYKPRFVNSLIVIVLLVITIIAMIIITTNSKNLNILNYKDRLEAMYNEKEDNLAKWDAELKERESELDEREKMLEEEK